MPAANLPSAMLTAPGPHPDAALLRQYAAGTLSPAEQQRIEAHTIDCERCADMLTGFAMTDAPTTDHAVAELRARLQERVREPAPLAFAARPLWPRVAAAAATVAVLAGGIWSWQQQSAPAEVAAVRTEAAIPEPTEAHKSAPPDAPEEAASIESVEAAASLPAVPAVPAAPKASAPAARRRLVARAERSRATAPAATAAADALVLADAETVEPAAGIAAVETPPEPVENANQPAADKPGNSQASEAAVPQTSPASKAKLAAKADALGEEGTRRAEPMPAGPTVAPAPMGGTVALREYLRRSAAQFEPAFNKTRLTGSVQVRFIVGEDGKVSNVKVTRGLRADYDSEAQRIVCDGPSWQPGISGGRRAPLPVDVVVPF